MNTLPQSSRMSESHRRRSASRPRAVKATAPVPVFIAYGDVPAARCAMTQIATMIERRQASEYLQPMLWRFDQLSAPGWREMALRDATRAAAVVIALSEEMSLHSGAEAWLTALAARHFTTPVDVIAVLNEEQWSISLQRTDGAGALNANAVDGPTRDRATRAEMEMLRKKMTARAA